MAYFFYVKDLELDCLPMGHTENDANSHLVNLNRHLNMNLFHCDLIHQNPLLQLLKRCLRQRKKVLRLKCTNSPLLWNE